MPDQIKIENAQCQICHEEMKNNLLVSALLNEKWSLFICPRKVNEKLVALGCNDVATGNAYKRFAKKFKKYLSCPHYLVPVTKNVV